MNFLLCLLLVIVAILSFLGCLWIYEYVEYHLMMRRWQLEEERLERRENQ